jgi:NCS1 family nucleobase:cation symporter-1
LAAEPRDAEREVTITAATMLEPPRQTPPTTASRTAAPLGIETRSIDFIPEGERHGRLTHQGQFWFLSNFHFFVIAIGFVGPSLGLSLGYTALAGAIGILIGTTFQAFHAAQGPRLGLPQMIQSRAQFGYRGVIVPLIATMVCLVGYNLVAVILIADGVHGMWGLNRAASAVTVSLVAAAVALWGHHWVHRMFRLLFWISLPLIGALSLAILLGRAGGVAHGSGGFNWPAFATQVASAASFNITAAPYVSDYTRYLPSRTRRGAVIACVFGGSGLSAVWLIALGAWLATHMGVSDGLVALRLSGDAVTPGFGSVLAAASIGGLTATIAMSAYSAMLTAFTMADGVRPILPGKSLKAAMIAVLMLVWLTGSMSLGGDAVTWVNALLVILLYAIAPWTAVNLIDYFFLRRGRYSLRDLFTPTGIYGAWGARGLIAYAAGFAASLPFFTAPNVYTAPMAARLGGVDVGWLVSLAVAGATYLLVSLRFDRAAEAARVATEAR